MCSRNYHGGLDNPWLELNSWSLDDYKNIMTEEVLHQLNSISFCGNYGDPLMNKDLVGMCRYTTQTNPNISIRIHTNASIQNKKYWKELAKSLPANHIVIFAIDGLEDTNHIYRIGTVFNKIIENAKAFIAAGGNAEWAFLVFKHNEHQIEAAEQMAKDLGFKMFTKKNSNRFLLTEEYPVFDKAGNTIYNLQPATNNQIVFINVDTIKNYKEIVKKSEISCFAKNNNEVYIDAQGNLFPCCFIGMTPYNYYEDTELVYPIRHEMMDQYQNLISDFGGIEKLNAKTTGIKNIIDGDVYQNIWSKYWTDPKMIVCARTCGKNEISKPMDQFIKREDLNG
jgi:hypothetical protein